MSRRPGWGLRAVGAEKSCFQTCSQFYSGLHLSQIHVCMSCYFFQQRIFQRTIFFFKR